MSIESRFRESAKRLVHRSGRTRVYEHKVGDGEYDVETGTVTDSVTLHTIKVMKVEPKERDVKSPNLVNRKAAKMLIAAIDLDFKPSIGDKIMDQYLGVDDMFEVMDVQSDDVGDQVALWKLICVQV